MKSIEGELDTLLREVEPLLEPVHHESQKWFLINENTQELRKVKNEQEAMFYSYVARIAQLPAFSRCKTAFDRDNTFKGASRLAGYWGTFEARRGCTFVEPSLAFQHPVGVSVIVRLAGLRVCDK